MRRGRQVSCAVPHCVRARSLRYGEPDDLEWLCEDHWSMTSPTARRRMRQLVRHARARDAAPGWARLATEQWERLKRQAIERAAGIA